MSRDAACENFGHAMADSPPSPSNAAELLAFRTQIDKLDRDLLALLNQRATLSVISGPGFSAFRPSITWASRSGRNATEPSRRLISPTCWARAARRFSSSSSSRSIASIRAR